MDDTIGPMPDRIDPQQLVEAAQADGVELVGPDGLSGDGLIDIIPQVGSRVATYQPHEVGDFSVMFGGLEGSIAGIAATAGPSSNSPPDAISCQIDDLRSETGVPTRAHGATGCGTVVFTRPST